ncbi:MAG: PD-(D/E)XK nuclease family protein [Cyclobacteriaceae bacterium]|jgi:CRISPR/Cas system-associated exonuclease Cas4 (RecB family)
MTPFLQQLADDMLAGGTPLEQLTFVFPNRRAGLFFQHHLAQRITKPQWSPRLLSIEEFFREHTKLREPDRLTLIYQLYQVYMRVIKREEPFDKFYFWGDMLLRDFDEVDKYRVNALLLFKDLSKLKELDETFDYLTEEQKHFLKEFWRHFEDQPSQTKDEFLRLWRKLPLVYSEFVKALKKEGNAYEGLIHREVAEMLEKKPPKAADAAHTVFAGFNALTRAEEALLAEYVKQGARVFWDYDAYYVNDSRQEAGMFARLYRQHPVLGKTFPAEWPAHFKTPRSIAVTGVSQRIGQAKLAGARVKEIIDQIPLESRDSQLNRTVIVLPDEALLLPVLHSLPEELTSINVTMGFPLRATPLFTLLDLLIEMQVRRKGDLFSYREVSAILGHPYVMALAEKESNGFQNEIVSRNRVRLPASELQATHALFQLAFQPVEPPQAVSYLLDLVQYLGASFTDKQSFDREYAYHFYQHLARLKLIFQDSDRWPDWRGFQKLFRQVIQSQKIPFTGEPLRGLQIMGVLETRNLDFDNVIMLSMNEGSLPAPQRQGSYIPHTLRKAYGLPAHDHQDAMYAYLFYRVLQRAGSIDLLYNTEPDVIGNGEMSRYVQQLLLESGLQVERRVLHNTIHVNRAKPIIIEKTPEVLRQLDKYLATSGARYLSPSSINDFIECELRFYLKHVAELREADEVEEDIDARTFGNILHDVMAWLYAGWRKSGKPVTAEEFQHAKQQLPGLIDRAFRKHYFLEDEQLVEYEGQRVVVKEVVEAFASRILEIDAAQSPLTIVQLEEKFEFPIQLADGRLVRVGGKIDRVDQTNDFVRIIDYKTGRDKLEFESIESLFERDQARNKAAFQTLLYAYAYSIMQDARQPVKPGLYSRTNLFGDQFNFGLVLDREPVQDARLLFERFAGRLRETVGDLYDPGRPFAQTTHEKHCEYCAYNALCRR